MANRRLWLDRSARFKGLVVVAIPVVALLLSAYLWRGAAAEAQHQADRVQHSLMVQRQIDAVIELARDSDGQVRSYGLSGNPQLLERPKAAMAALLPEVDRLVRLLGDNPVQRERVERLRPVLEARLRIARVRVADVEAGLPDPEARVLQAAGLTTRIRDGLDAVKDQEGRLLAARQDAVDAATESLNRLTVVIVAAGALGGVAATVLYSRSIARRLDVVVANAELLAEKQPLTPVAEAADEIGRVDAALREASDLLVERRERELAASVEARRANQAKSEFLSRMSHELRTPLNAVIGFAQILELSNLEPADAEAVGHIRRAGAHLLQLINEVLDLTRIEAGALTVSPEPVALDEAISDVITLMRPAAAANEITLVDAVDREACGPHVMADRQRLKQILLNLVSNAIKYNSAQGTVTVACSRPTDATVRITVTDTGAGISPENQELLFKPFERLGAEQSSVEGTGIGLSLSRELTELMGGTLAVDSRPGTGSTFWVELPAAEVVIDAGDDPTTIDLSEAPAAEDLRTVLHIEDNGASAAIVSHVLERQGVTVIAATQGRAGIETARQVRPDLILLDLHLPDIDGHDALHILKRDPATAHVPVVVISADATTGTIRRTLTAGAFDFLTKPLDIRHLLRILGTLQQAQDQDTR